MTIVRQIRAAAHMTALTLAEKANSNETRIYAFERGRYQPRPDEARRIAAVLGTKPETLFPKVFPQPVTP